MRVMAFAAKHDGCNIIGKKMQRQHPAGAAQWLQRWERLRTDDPVLGDGQAEFLVQFAQGALRRAFVAFAAATGQIDEAGPRYLWFVITAIHQNMAINQRRQPGTDKICAIAGRRGSACQLATAWACR